MSLPEFRLLRPQTLVEAIAMLAAHGNQAKVIAGGVSPENAAQQVVPPGATWQRSPSFFKQKPQLLRHCSDWLYQRQRVSRQMLPPIVRMLRKTGEAIVFTAACSTG